MGIKYNPVRGCKMSRHIMSGVTKGKQVCTPHNSTLRGAIKRQTNRRIRRTACTELPAVSLRSW